MGFLGNAQTENSSSAMANQTNKIQDQVTLVGEGSLFDGTFKINGDVRAHGRIIGTLEVAGKAMIAEQGEVEGDIIATGAEIAGQVQGEIHVEECLILKSSARVDGKIETERLVIEEGAHFTGECKTGTQIPGKEGPPDGVGGERGEMLQTESDASDDRSDVDEVPDVTLNSEQGSEGVVVANRSAQNEAA